MTGIMSDLQFTLLLVVVILVGVAGFGLSSWLRSQKENAPARALRGIDALLTVYEHLAINAREVSEAQARIAANAARYAAIQKRIAELPAAGPSVPASVSVTLSNPA